MQPSLTTKRLVLCPFTQEDVEPLQQLAGEREIADTMVSVPQLKGNDEHRRSLYTTGERRVLDLFKTTVRYEWAMRLFLMFVLIVVSTSACRRAGIEHVALQPVQERMLPNQITIVTWNVYKGNHARLPDDLRALVRRQQPELVFLQEATADLLSTTHMAGHFTPSWQYPLLDGTTTGVLTLSRVQSARTEAVRTRWREFFVAAPKVALITEYPLPNGAQLLAVNVHCLNFERWGTFKLRAQLSTLKGIMAQHSGPIILAGDFNTWNHKRLSLMTAMASELNLIEADGFSGRLKTADRYFEALNWLLGIDKDLALDRVYYRGLSQLSAAVLPYISSDHTALQVTFSVNGTHSGRTRASL